MKFKVNLNMEVGCQVFLTLLLVLELCEAARNFDIVFAKSNCSVRNADYVAEYVCPINELPRNRGNYLSGNIRFKRDITKITLDFRIQMPSLSSPANAKLDLMKFRTDGCQLWSYKASNPILAAILKKLQSGGNFPGGCPLKANVNYTVKYFALNPDYLPPYAPEMTFTATLNMFTDKIHLISAEVEAKVVRKKGALFKPFR